MKFIITVLISLITFSATAAINRGFELIYEYKAEKFEVFVKTGDRNRAIREGAYYCKEYMRRQFNELTDDNITVIVSTCANPKVRRL